MRKQTVSLQLDIELIDKLRKLATQEGLTLSAYIRRLLIIHSNKELSQ